ncbi:hypothetical protein PPO43_12105 [Saprospira sp. CCB-QB6]|uniref:beta strand repeat-containing protein n=1 Tax=Saprospira sp. CCB-QB6 TaxID=3023936 RepID=UPI00234B1ECA|nr:hypothetical protein [Saprospira sp. CCB-QB6]WCL80713.1 hypothetical protein PPO43_12105 [Saprospira sp. CCB-QB6]
MRSFIYAFLVLLLSVGSWGQLQAQESDGYGGHWFLGGGGGVAWQQSDACTQLGGGWTIYLGKNIYYSPTKPLSLDLRMRYMGTVTYGQDDQLTNIANNSLLNGQSNSLFDPDYSVNNGGTNFVYHNHRTAFNDLSLEARINFENLRRKHNIWLSLYGGIGLGWYRVAYDQLDQRVLGFDEEYINLYNSVAGDSTLSSTEIVDQLVGGRDGDYETFTDGWGDYSVMFTPSVGFEFGYWVTPRFAIGVGHRVNWTLTDNFDGIVRDGNNEIHHFSHLFLHGRLTDHHEEEVKPLPDPQAAPPQVNFTNPSGSSATTNNSSYTVRATVRNVRSSSDIRFVQNGQIIDNFNYNSGNGSFQVTIRLQEGANNINIRVNNPSGTDQDVATINYEPIIRQDPPPSVVITSPSSDPYTTNSTTASVRATIRNVNHSNNVSCTVNGQSMNHFSFSGTSFSLNNIILQNGSNTVVVSASNNAGQASDQTIIIYKQPVNNNTNNPNPPTVNITSPSSDPYNSSSSSTTVRATIRNIRSSNSISFTVNGQVVRNFSFSGTSFVASNINLQQGSNNIVISASNPDGNASDQTTIIYQPVRNVTPPTVNITTPSANPYNSNNNTATVRATIRNVRNSRDISFTVNGQASSSFSFSGTSFVATGINLQQGNNFVVISASNPDGNASDQTTIIYQPQRTPTPPIVNITSPSADPYTSSTNRATVRATIQHVNNNNDVQMQVNGQNIRNFSFAGTNFVATNINLQQGHNVVVISASNPDGTASDQTTIIYKPQRVPTPPTVDITSPSSDPYTSNAAQININASIRNVSNSSNVQMQVNGQSIRRFSLNGTSFVANNVNLQQGNNVVVISASNPDGTASDQTTIIYKPQRVPTPPTVDITSPSSDPYTSNAAQININASIRNVSNSSNVQMQVNGQSIRRFSLNGTSFVANNVNLQQGNNVVVISASNSDGTASDQTTIIYKPQRVPTPPTVDITSPSANPYNTASNTASIRATIQHVDNNRAVTFTVNGQTIRNFSFSGSSFVANNVSLQQGNNTIVVAASNQDGNASDQTVIIYKPTRVPTPPTVDITSPSANPYNTASNTASIRATIQHVDNNRAVTFTVNGQTIRNFSFSGTSFVANNVSLQQGNNTIVVAASNQDGNASDQTVIIYKPTRVPTPPVVTITTPSADPYSSPANTTNIRANIQHVDNNNNVRFTVNGRTVRNFSFSGTSFVANNVSLQQGNNTIVVAASNQDGNASDQTMIIYKPAPAPTVKITSPAANPHTVSQNKIDIQADIFHVSSANDIRFTVNGQTNRNFRFSNNKFTAPNIRLNTGNNTFVISASNAQGNASDQTVVIYQPAVQPPTVDITTPSRNPYTAASNSTNIRATIRNVSSSNDVSFLVNGRAVSNFSFSGTNFSAINIPLQQGNNSISISGQNSAGTASDAITIIYNPVPAPDVRNLNVSVAPNLNKCFAAVSAEVLNVSGKNEVSFQINGRTISDFTLAGNRFNARVDVSNLGTGTISFVVSAQNAGGSDTETERTSLADCSSNISGGNSSTIGGNNNSGGNNNTKNPNNSGGNNGVNSRPKPSVTFTSPRLGTSSVRTINVSATITNVDNRSQVRFKLNGQNMTNFQLSGINFQANNIGLRAGSNILEITATNNNGSTTQTFAITYNAGGGTSNTADRNANNNQNNSSNSGSTVEDKKQNNKRTNKTTTTKNQKRRGSTTTKTEEEKAEEAKSQKRRGN